MKLTLLAIVLLLISNNGANKREPSVERRKGKSGKVTQVLKDANVPAREQDAMPPAREWVPDSPAMKIYKTLTDEPWKVILLVVAVGGFMFAIGRWRGRKAT